MDDLERCKQALEEGDVSAVVSIADIMLDQQHPEAEELSLLAYDIVNSEDSALVTLSLCIFTEILKEIK